MANFHLLTMERQRIASLSSGSTRVKSLASVFNKRQLWNVKIVTDDHEDIIYAHKVVLVSASQEFEKIILSNEDVKVLDLKGYKHEDIKNIIHFIYHGSVEIETSKMESFLATANILKIYDLTAEDAQISTSHIDKADVQTLSLIHI